MTIAVDLGRKATKQTKQIKHLNIIGKEKLTLPWREEVRVVLESDSTEVMRSHCAPTQSCLP